ncbi:MAG TPA: L-glutamate gamma-semialdehyde dehydrogenase [Polyangiaceae bacterium]|nr:L-glutamate gamma-semialdehyde dehydrogenase [Polyangiaceae bacterium]
MFDVPQALPLPANEPVLTYGPGSPERAALRRALERMATETPTIPHVIGGKPVYEGASFEVRAPHRRQHVLARAAQAGAAGAERAVRAALAAQPAWAAASFEERSRVFLRAAELLAGPWRQTLNAATMLGQSKSVQQAEIDAACELVDFLRFNVAFASRLVQEPISAPGQRNLLELRPLEGFVLAVTPFNFTAIAANLPAAPALLGNVVVWKPAETQSLAAYHTMRLFQAAGLPDGVINVVYGDGAPVGEACLSSPHLAGVHFTGSTKIFQHLWRGVGERIASYRTYPRLVGETGGKDFVFAHPSADVSALALALVRGAFEYQGQKCSAASRAYVPASLWPALRERCVALMNEIKVGDVADFSTFCGAVIDGRAFARLRGWLERLRADASCRIVAGGTCDDAEGYFVDPTLVEVSDPRHALMQEELFGPVLAVYVYPDGAIDETLELVDSTSPYALTGAIFSQDRQALAKAARALRQAAGNLYFNDKPTGAVVAQQPFGGARASGTNDKAGSAYNLLRWVSPRTIKETFVPPITLGYPHQATETP